MKSRGLSVKSKKALKELVGESAGTEIAELINQMATEIESLRRKTHTPTPTLFEVPDSHAETSDQTVL